MSNYIITYITKSLYSRSNRPSRSKRKRISSTNFLLGSLDLVTNTGHDAGLLSTIYEAYGRHFILRTSPDDWWYTITQTIALAIESNSFNEKVRRFFVDFYGKQNIRIIVNAPLILENVDYKRLFEEFTQSISNHINVPSYVREMSADFSTTTDVQRIGIWL